MEQQRQPLPCRHQQPHHYRKRQRQRSGDRAHAQRPYVDEVVQPRPAARAVLQLLTRMPLLLLLLLLLTPPRLPRRSLARASAAAAAEERQGLDTSNMAGHEETPKYAHSGPKTGHYGPVMALEDPQAGAAPLAEKP